MNEFWDIEPERVQFEQFEYERDYYGDKDDEEGEVDYGEIEEIEDEDVDLGGQNIFDNDFRNEMDDAENIGGEGFVNSYFDRERVGGPISSVAQIKSLINIFGGSLGKKEAKISFSNLTDEDILKLLLNNSVYSNKLNNYYPTVNFTNLMEGMFPLLKLIPNLKYKNPSALFLGYLCTKKVRGDWNISDLDKWKPAINALNIYCSDVVRYHKLWKQIYNRRSQ